jgi:hypothetical protein
MVYGALSTKTLVGYFTLCCMQLKILFTGEIDKAKEYYLCLKSISTNVRRALYSLKAVCIILL